MGEFLGRYSPVDRPWLGDEAGYSRVGDCFRRLAFRVVVSEDDEGWNAGD